MSFDMEKMAVIQGKTALGIEFGSTKIKAVLIDFSYNQLAEGSCHWRSSYKNGNWTYLLDEAIAGM